MVDCICILNLFFSVMQSSQNGAVSIVCLLSGFGCTSSTTSHYILTIKVQRTIHANDIKMTLICILTNEDFIGMGTFIYCYNIDSKQELLCSKKRRMRMF